MQSHHISVKIKKIMEIRLGVYPVSPVDRLKRIRDKELKVGKFLDRKLVNF